jgi:DNA-binding CsgD family transcriptional regulator
LAGSLEPGEDGLAMLREAVSVLERTPARLEHARALVNLGVGLRPRRARLRGPDAPTPAELRTARMAAGGLSNRAIAQALFVSAKTVETQLSHAYAKLGIAGRSELASSLAQKPKDSAAAPAGAAR